MDNLFPNGDRNDLEKMPKTFEFSFSHEGIQIDVTIEKRSSLHSVS